MTALTNQYFPEVGNATRKKLVILVNSVSFVQNVQPTKLYKIHHNWGVELDGFNKLHRYEHHVYVCGRSGCEEERISNTITRASIPSIMRFATRIITIIPLLSWSCFVLISTSFTSHMFISIISKRSNNWFLSSGMRHSPILLIVTGIGSGKIFEFLAPIVKESAQDRKYAAQNSQYQP